ncbi:MAG: hypothetical protein COW13_04820, partial [Candidatus Omnitrophica bacterium CG12_big_fil_rev_8_21_14_0_65_50_5]
MAASLRDRLRNGLLRRIARMEGFLDPILVLANLGRFAQPSELLAPKELLRAGAVIQARGLINSQAIQHNMDWIWPYWVERQFDPLGDSFIPRAFNLTHLNLTHRNWTAAGIPDFKELSIVDPRGLVTPLYDGWSLDAWILDDKGLHVIPSQMDAVRQEWDFSGNPRILTKAADKGMTLHSAVEAYEQSGTGVCRIEYEASSAAGGWLVVSLRPCNPEGISFVHKIVLLEKGFGWKVDGHYQVHFDLKPDRAVFSEYWKGDVFGRLFQPPAADAVECQVGMATAAALFRLEPNVSRQVTVSVPLKKNAPLIPAGDVTTVVSKWNENLEGTCRADLPDKHFQFLYDAAVRSLILHSPEQDLYPGPYTYKRFWFRDAAFILDAMLAAGMQERVKKIIDGFPARQTTGGHFLSQDGEWDSNGEALWVMNRFCEMTGQQPDPAWKRSILKAAHWLENKREFKKGSASFGLLPAGFSAEHLGPNDNYYWDDFWGVAGFCAGAVLADHYGEAVASERYSDQAGGLLNCIDASLKRLRGPISGEAMPASPHRRMDAGAIGSLAAGYPLRLFDPRDPRLLDTAEYLYEKCFIHGGFYQEISHSGINVYLSLQVAQVFLRAGDPRYFRIMKAIASMASPTGQWPEAIHPGTGGGCMGDGQHLWAAAEWVLMLRNCFVREEADGLILFSGIPEAWLESRQEIRFGPAPTAFGPVRLSVRPEGEQIALVWEGRWFGKPPKIEIFFCGVVYSAAPESEG